MTPEMTYLEYHLRNFARFYWRASKVKFDFSKDVPSNEGKSLDEVITAIAELMHEIDEHNPKSDRRKVSARVEEQNQIIELAWNGGALPLYRLQLVNGRYDAGMKSPVNTFAGGAFSAAYGIGKHGGTVKIENFEHPIYTSRNVVTLPLSLP